MAIGLYTAQDLTEQDLRELVGLQKSDLSANTLWQAPLASHRS
jgi:hypothetical protein